jgi:hypothetical protein
MDRAVRSLMMGVAFAVAVAMGSVFMKGGTHWPFWLIVPAMLLFGRGFVELARVHGARNRLATTSPPQLNSGRQLDLTGVKTGELVTGVPSVTEGTTRHLEGDARTRKL